MSKTYSAADDPNAQTPSEDILATQIGEGMDQLQRPTSGLLLSALSAGLDMGFGPLLMAATYFLVSDAWGEPLTTIAVANIYAIGFLFVILGQTELFTEHTTLAVLPVLDDRASLTQLGRLWSLVFVGNVVGGAVFAAAAVVLAPKWGIAEHDAFLHLGESLLGYEPVFLFFSAILAGWLMGLLSWLVSAAQETLSRVVFVWLVTAAIGFMHLPHCIAGNVEVLMAVLAGSTYGFGTYAGFLALSTAGNVVGGSVFVALLKYGHVVRGTGSAS